MYTGVGGVDSSGVSLVVVDVIEVMMGVVDSLWEGGVTILILGEVIIVVIGGLVTVVGPVRGNYSSSCYISSGGSWSGEHVIMYGSETSEGGESRNEG